MPLYSYQVINEDGTPGEIIELLQRINDLPLKRHPETGACLQRLISAPRVLGEHSDRATKRMLGDNKRLGELGFTKYERRGKGVMERTAGTQGPKVISSD